MFRGKCDKQCTAVLIGTVLVFEMRSFRSIIGKGFRSCFKVDTAVLPFLFVFSFLWKKLRAASAKRVDLMFALLRQARELTRLQEVAPTLDEQIATA